MRRLTYFMGAVLTMLWIGTNTLHAQQTTGTVRGRVTDNATQQGLSGVTVAAGGRSVLTQPDGRYVINGVPTGAQTVRARVIGYAQATSNVTVAAGQEVVADLALTGQALTLSEVVVTGYGEQRAANITGAVSSVADSQFNPGRVISPQMLIQNKVPGVQVVDNNDPGGGLSIRIRGASSATASNEPLYVVDGVPLGTGAGGGLSAGRDPLNYLNPQDIANITILRDASSAAIYGSNAANGVVIITTKSGKGHSGAHVEFNTNASASQVTRVPDLLNAAQFAQAVATYAPTRVDSLLGQNTNWFDEIDHTGYGQEYDLALTNNTGDMGYRLSLGYEKQNGIIRASSVDRLTLGLNYEQSLFNDKLHVSTNVRGARNVDHFTPGDVLGNAAAMAPTQPVLNPASPTGYWDWNTTNASPSNPVASLALASDQGTTWRSVGNVQAAYRLPYVEGLTANVNLGYDLTKADRQTFYPNNLAAQIRQGQGLLTLTNNNQGNSVLETYLDYSPQVAYGPGMLNLVGGYSYQQSHAEYPTLKETGLQSNLLGDNGVPPATNITNTMTVTDFKLISFFGRANYNINDRYMAGFSVRRDGSSRFGPTHQWGTFPAVSLGWRISQEPFMQGVGGLSDLKLRGSWAQTGNQAFGDYLYYPTYTYSDALTKVQIGNQYITTIRPSAVDQGIHWEKTSAYDAGLDYGFSNQRFSGSIDWYVKNTSDLLFNVPVAAGTNLGNFVTTNIGKMKNTGIEFEISAKVFEPRPGHVNWDASFTASHNSNELVGITPTKNVARILTGGISGGVGNLVEVLQPGVPINSFFVYQQRYDAQGKPVYDPANPTNMYVDQNKDGLINDGDRRPFHDPSPKWILGHTSYVSFGKWDGGFTLRAYLGNWVYNNVASTLGAYQNLTGSAMPANLHASVLQTGFVVPQYYSDYYVQDGSFLRMDNITLGYSFNVKNQPFRLYGTVQNAFTITGYDGVDPTAGLNGIDNNIYPRSRTITTGLSARF
ncbi:MAG TPA: SusC/RagA family TonB-linked outer membrane protein [Gemmatimonadales bacterium]|nr:SusC/RagA family TonB-linked outer membrane protein [Gemmatimonadales bacterium]